MRAGRKGKHSVITVSGGHPTPRASQVGVTRRVAVPAPTGPLLHMRAHDRRAVPRAA
jgi:hypothetical protein